MQFNVYVCVIIILLLHHCTCDYLCLCNYDVEQPVYKNADSSEIPVGALYEYDCNTLISDGDPLWATIAFHHKVTFVAKNPQTKIQMCPGNEPEMDKLLMTVSTEMSTIHSTKSPTTTMSTTTKQATSMSTTPSPTTTMSTSTTQATTMTTTPSPTTSMSTSTTQAATMTTPSPTTTMSTTTTQATTMTTTPSPTTSMSTSTTQAAAMTTPSPTTTMSTTTTQATTMTTTPSPTTTMSTTTTQATTMSTTPIPTTMSSTSTSATLPTTNTPTITTQSTTLIPTVASFSTDGNLDLCHGYIKNDANKNNGFLGQHGQYCYELVDTPTVWGAAERHCRLLLNGSLVHILSQTEQDYIVKFLTVHSYIKSVWIGLTDSNAPSIAVTNSTEGNWKWSSGAPYSYNNFGNEFTSHTDQQHNLNDCAVMHQGGEWSDLPCGINLGIFGFGESHPYICQIDISSSTPSVINILNEVVG